MPWPAKWSRYIKRYTCTTPAGLNVQYDFSYVMLVEKPGQLPEGWANPNDEYDLSPFGQEQLAEWFHTQALVPFFETHSFFIQVKAERYKQGAFPERLTTFTIVSLDPTDPKKLLDQSYWFTRKVEKDY